MRNIFGYSRHGILPTCISVWYPIGVFFLPLKDCGGIGYKFNTMSTWRLLYSIKCSYFFLKHQIIMPAMVQSQICPLKQYRYNTTITSNSNHCGKVHKLLVTYIFFKRQICDGPVAKFISLTVCQFHSGITKKHISPFCPH